MYRIYYVHVLLRHEPAKIKGEVGDMFVTQIPIMSSKLAVY